MPEKTDDVRVDTGAGIMRVRYFDRIMKSWNEIVYVDINNKAVRKAIRRWLYIGLYSVFLFVITLILIYLNLDHVLLKITAAIQIVVLVTAILNFIKLRQYISGHDGL